MIPKLLLYTRDSSQQGARGLTVGVEYMHYTDTRTTGLETSVVQSVIQFRRGPPRALTTPSQRTAPLPSVNTSTEYSLARATQFRYLGRSLPAHSVITGACYPILPGGIVIGNQVRGVEGVGRAVGGFVNRHHTSAWFFVLPQPLALQSAVRG